MTKNRPLVEESEKRKTENFHYSKWICIWSQKQEQKDSSDILMGDCLNLAVSGIHSIHRKSVKVLTLLRVEC